MAIMEFTEATFDDVKIYLERTGKRGKEVLSILGRINPEIHAIFGTEVGREILKEDLSRIEELMIKQYKNEIEPKELVELAYLKEIRMPRILGKLRTYLVGMGEIK